MNITFTAGEAPSLLTVLAVREKRTLLQEKLCHKYPSHSLIAYKLNVPGPVKNNATIQRIFQIGKEDLYEVVRRAGWEVVALKEINAATGPELFLVVSADARKVKAETILLEEETPLGRIFDLDVLYSEDDQRGRAVSLKRSALGFPERSCFLCAAPAKECGRSRQHTVEELQERMTFLIQEERRF